MSARQEANASRHKVETADRGFVVRDGNSGSYYCVEALVAGGAACNCPHARRMRSIASDCSHVLAVQGFALALALALAAKAHAPKALGRYFQGAHDDDRPVRPGDALPEPKESKR